MNKIKQEAGDTTSNRTAHSEQNAHSDSTASTNTASTSTASTSTAKDGLKPKQSGRRRFMLSCTAGVLIVVLTLWGLSSAWSSGGAERLSGGAAVRVEMPTVGLRQEPVGVDDLVDNVERLASGRSESGDDSDQTAATSSDALDTEVAESDEVPDDSHGPHVDTTDSGESSTASPDGHPIDPALRVAEEGLAYLQNHVQDYTATIIKRERAKNGNLPERQVLFCKIRHRRLDADGKLQIPFSIYLKFLEPASIAGREVVWVENQNDGKLIAHEPGIKNLIRFKLDPAGFIAMVGQRYSLQNIGIENLIQQLIKRGKEERRHGDVENCQVKFIENVKLDGRECTLIEIQHPRKSPSVTCFVARIFFDNERQVPVRYAAYLWPEPGTKDMPVDEEYTYRDMKLNVGLTDLDFDPDNPDYDFP